MLFHGGVDAMFHELVNRKITSDLRVAPVTEALEEQRVQSLSRLDSKLLEVAASGVLEIPDEHTVHVKRIALSETDETSVQRSQIMAWAEAAVDKSHEKRGLRERLGKTLRKIGVEDGPFARVGNGVRDRTYIFPALGEFRKAVGKALGVSMLLNAEVERGIASDMRKREPISEVTKMDGTVSVEIGGRDAAPAPKKKTKKTPRK